MGGRIDRGDQQDIELAHTLKRAGLRQWENKMARRTQRKSRSDIEAMPDQQAWIPQNSYEHDQIDGALKPLTLWQTI